MPVAATGSAPIVGRIDERKALLAAYAQAVTGRAQVLLITGEAGIGKTRLIEDLVQQVRSGERAAQVRIGESAPLAGAALAYGPFVAALGDGPPGCWLTMNPATCSRPGTVSSSGS